MTIRTGGGRWRILVHERLKRHSPDEVAYGTAHSIGSSAKMAGKKRGHVRPVILPGTEFDELVVGHWLHIEQQCSTVWWMNVAGVNINVTVDRDGQPKYVTVDEADPGDWPDCAYWYERS